MPTYEQFQQTRYFTSLDGLRCLSILPVIWHHSCLVPPPGILGKGPAGIQLFFVISGFLVTTLLLRERGRFGTLSLRRFYARRALRIFPLYYLVLAAVTLHAWLSAPSAQRSHFFESWPFFATYTSNWWVNWSAPHAITFAFAWTLAIEEQFYSFWPPVLRWSSGWLPAAMMMLILLFVSQAVVWPELGWLFPEDSFWNTFCSGLSSSIALGSLLALVLDSRVGFGVVRRVLGLGIAAPLLALAVVACLVLNVWHMIFHVTLCLWLGSTVVRPDHGLCWLLDHPALLKVGQLSYGLYLTHCFVVEAVRGVVDPTNYIMVFAVTLPIALLVAQVSQHFVEQPFLRRKARFAPA